MIIPKPEKGQVVFYSFLWPYQSKEGLVEGTKDRPCLLVSLRDLRGKRQRAVLLPITHIEPKDKTEAIELPTNVKKMLDLDDRRSWVWVTQTNVLKWPGGDLRPVPGKEPPTTLVGKVPAGFLKIVSERYIQLLQANKLTPVNRIDDIGDQRSFRHGSPKAS